VDILTEVFPARPKFRGTCLSLQRHHSSDAERRRIATPVTEPPNLVHFLSLRPVGGLGCVGLGWVGSSLQHTVASKFLQLWLL